MVQDSRQYSEDANVKTFLTSLVNSVVIGPLDSLLAFAVFDGSVHIKLKLGDSLTASDLLEIISSIHLYHRSDYVDVSDVISDVRSYVIDHKNGDRPDVPDAVIIVSDQESEPDNGDYFTSDEVAVIQNHRNVIVNVGREAQDRNGFSRLAPDANHVFNINSYSDLPGLAPQIIVLICE